MKRYLKLLFAFLTTAILFILMNSVNAATTNLTAKDTVTAGDTIKVTVSVNAAQWNLTLTANGTKIGGWVETVNYKENLSKTFTASYKASNTGTVQFALTGDITDFDQTNKEINKTKAVTVKTKTTPTPKPTTTSTPKPTASSTPKEPNFKSANKTVYTTGTVNLRASWSTSSAATQVAKGTELKLIGTSTENINGYVWYKVTYKGATKYISSSLVSATKPKEESSNKSLSSLKIEGVELTPEFNSSTTQYTANVDKDVTELKITAKAEDSKAKVVTEGNKDLKEGDNIVKIKVTAEDGTTRTYFITVIKEGENETAGETTTTNNDEGLKLSELKIERVNFENSFKPDTYTYELSVNSYIEKLDITATPNKEGAKVEITGNENFKEGDNLVTILVSSADGLETATYQIKVVIPEGAIEQVNKQNDLMKVIGGIAVAVVIILVIIFILCHRANKKYDDEEDYDGYEEEEEEKASKRVKVSKQETNESDLDATIDDFTKRYEDEDKPRKSKGRHSM